MELSNQNIVVIGLGMSGVATARFLKAREALVTVTDSAPERKLEPQAEIMRKLDIDMELGQNYAAAIKTADLIVLSPGVPHTIGPVNDARERGVPVIGEIELASRFIREPIIAITGTNGKTTTTELVGKMLESSGFSVFVGGNIGNPLVNYVGGRDRADVVVAEISSFQLDTIDTFRPKVGVLLNISEDHLDRYRGFDDYARSKARVFENQSEKDIAVYNGSDPRIGALCANIKSGKRPFYHRSEAPGGVPEVALIDREQIILRPMQGVGETIDLSITRMVGRHNMENIAAAGLAAMAVGADIKGIKAALKDFRGLAHRLEYVDSIDDVRYFDDSKATNVDAVARALECFSRPVILIMGGRNKGNDFRLLADKVHRHTRRVIVMGEAKSEIMSVISDQTRTTPVDTMKDAVLQAHKTAIPGDVVLLSPACASFDMYSSYAQRGDDFCEAVRELKTEQG